LNPLLVAELAAIGAVAGVVGSLLGLGGAFIIIPILRLVFGLPPAETSAVSLVMVVANSLSGSIGYLRNGRADVRLALVVAITGIPASVIGAYLVGKVSLAGFDYLYGAMLVYFFFDIMWRRNRPPATGPVNAPDAKERTLVDADGIRYTYATSVSLSLACGVVMGLVASFFGVGGGVVFVIFFIALLRMPTPIVTATSTLAIVLTSPAGVLWHVVNGNVDWSYALPLAAGGLVGGQFGPRLALRMSSPQLLTVLAYAMLLAAGTLILKHVLRF
jgi:uncharacterized membrane protein YfcA